MCNFNRQQALPKVDGQFIVSSGPSTAVFFLESQCVELSSLHALNRRICRPGSRPERVIVDFYPMGCCSSGVGFSERDSKQVPEFLSARGLRQVRDMLFRTGFVTLFQ